MPARLDLLRSFARSVLRSAGLLPLVRRLRNGHQKRTAAYYMLGGNMHNLLMVFRKTATPGRQPGLAGPS